MIKNEQDEETDEEIVNALVSGPRIEYYMRKCSTKERVHWKAPKSATMAAVTHTIDEARK